MSHDHTPEDLFICKHENIDIESITLCRDSGFRSEDPQDAGGYSVQEDNDLETYLVIASCSECLETFEVKDLPGMSNYYKPLEEFMARLHTYYAPKGVQELLIPLLDKCSLEELNELEPLLSEAVQAARFKKAVK